VGVIVNRFERPFEDTVERPSMFSQASASLKDGDHDEAMAPGSQGSDFPAQAELDEAIAHFVISAQLTGASEKHQTPFTRQLKSDTASRFPADKKYFDKANLVEREVIIWYIVLRVVTLLLFSVLLALQAVIFEETFTHSPRTETDSWSNVPQKFIDIAASVIGVLPQLGDDKEAVAIWRLVLVSILFVLLRIVIRWLWFRELSNKAHQLSYTIFARLEEINSRVTEVCAKVRERVGKGGDWSTRARNWTIIALWYAKRSEYLDRFITTVTWKVRTTIQHTENASLAIKGALSVFAVGMVSHEQLSYESGIFGLFILVQTYLFWHALGIQAPEFWTTQFRKSSLSGDHGKENYADKIGAVVENLVHEAVSKEFGQSGKQG
jgi:hypothetical protein